MTSQLSTQRLLSLPGTVDSGSDSSADDDSGQRPGLDVRPFRGLRYDPAVVPDVAAVTTPPYDVVRPEAVRSFEDLEPHNVVRLILPREDACGPEGRYAHAAATLNRWLADGVLVQDEPGFYVYEERDLSGAADGSPAGAAAGAVHRGLLAAVGLDGARTGAVLPHEEVMPGPVADRQALMRATGANLEPILLVHDGDPAAGEAVESVLQAACAGPALLDVSTPEGRRHRLWRVPPGPAADELREAFRRRRALIADGHHRWAAYQALAAENAALAGENAALAAENTALAAQEPAAPAPEAGWAAGLALLVDAERYPLALGAIHRLVAGLTLADALAALAGLEGSIRVTRLADAAVPDLSALAAAGARHPAFDLVAGDGAARLELLEPAAVADPDQPAAWSNLDAALLHGGLLARWEAGDGPGERAVSYCHDATSAVAAAQAGAGLAVLLNPVSVPEVLAVAAAGATMPRKSTSFGPKPRTGLVLRQVAGEAATPQS